MNDRLKSILDDVFTMKHYVQIRTYKKVGTSTYYSDWSNTKTVTTKK